MNDNVTIPETGDLVRVTYENDRGSEEEIDGRVMDVDDNPDTTDDEYIIEIDEGQPNRKIVVFVDGEDVLVTRYSEFSGAHNLGDTGVIEVL